MSCKYETVETTAKPHLPYHIGYLRFMQHSTGRASPVYAFPAKNAGSTTLAAWDSKETNSRDKQTCRSSRTSRNNMVSGLKAGHRKNSVCANIFEQSISTQPAALVIGQPLASVNVGVSILLIESRLFMPSKTTIKEPSTGLRQKLKQDRSMKSVSVDKASS